MLSEHMHTSLSSIKATMDFTCIEDRMQLHGLPSRHDSKIFSCMHSWRRASAPTQLAKLVQNLPTNVCSTEHMVLLHDAAGSLRCASRERRTGDEAKPALRVLAHKAHEVLAVRARAAQQRRAGAHRCRALPAQRSHKACNRAPLSVLTERSPGRLHHKHSRHRLREFCVTGCGTRKS